MFQQTNKELLELSISLNDTSTISFAHICVEY